MTLIWIFLYIMVGCIVLGFLSESEHDNTHGMEPLMIILWPFVLGVMAGAWVTRKLS